MFEDAHYRWREEPNDGEYELQFDRFESLEDDHDHTVLLIVDTEEDELIGQVTGSTEDVPGIDPEDAVRGAIFHGRVESGEIIDIRYDPERTEQRIEEVQERYERIRSTPDDENTDTEESEDR